MMQRRPKTRFQQASQTLRVDIQHARRQGENAIILPIVYEPAEKDHQKTNHDSDIVSISWPLKLPSRKTKTSIISLRAKNSEQDRREKLALLTKKVEQAKERIIKSRKVTAKELRTDASSGKAAGVIDAEKNFPRRYFATSVQLLLFSVFALIVFAWICFR